MTVHRQVNVHQKHISIASNFSAKLYETRFEINKLVLDNASFYKNVFWLEGKSLHLAYHIFRRCEKLKNKNFLLIISSHNRTCFSSKFLTQLFFSLKLHLPSLIFIMQFSLNFPVTTKNICAGRNSAHHFEKIRLNFYHCKCH